MELALNQLSKHTQEQTVYNIEFVLNIPIYYCIICSSYTGEGL